MDQGDHNNASTSLPMKRKRGRPRKYPILDTVEHSRPQRDPKSSSRENVNLQINQVNNHGENASLPPGFETVNGNQIWQGGNQGASDIMVGQVVSGVVEAVFDAGCLLAVQIGNSPTILRGVVLRPGHFVPVSAENDVAPNVQMIKRTEIPLPTVNSSRVQSHTFQAKEKTLPLSAAHRNGTTNTPSMPGNTTPDVNPSGLKHTYTPTLTQGLTPSNVRGDFMPFVMQAAYVSNVIPGSNQISQVVSQTAHPTSSVNQAASSSHPSNAALASASNEPTSSQTQTSLQMMSEDKPNESGIFSQLAETQNHMETNSTMSPRMSFQNLLTEVMKRAESPSQEVDPQADVCISVDNSPVHQSVATHENEHNQPLQPAESSHHNYSAAVPNSTSTQDNRTDKMSELLRVLQDNFDDNKNPEAQEPDAGCSSKTGERDLVTQFGDSQTNDSK